MNCSAGMPSRLLPSSPVVSCATTGRSLTLRTARIAAPISLTSRNVSSMNRSTPPSASACGLLAEDVFGFVEAGLAPRLDAHAERPDRPGHVRRVARRVPGEAGARHVDAVHPLGQPEGGELEPIGAERVGFDDVGAGPHVGLVDADHEVGLRQVQLVEGTIEEHALAHTAACPSRHRR